MGGLWCKLLRRYGSSEARHNYRNGTCVSECQRGEISSTSLDLWDEGLRNAADTIIITPQAWQQFFINGQVAPAGTAFVEVRVVVNDAVTGANPDPSAFFDDFVLELATVGVPGDYNGNGTVDAADYVLWRNGGPLQNEVDAPGTVNAADYAAWRARFGNSGSGSGLGGGASVPEPASCSLVTMALVCGAAAIRRRRLAERHQTL